MNNIEIKKGYFGEFGGAFVDDSIKKYLNDVEKSFLDLKDDKSFINELEYYYKDYIGRETPLYFAKNLTEKIGGAKIYLKREDLCHTGAHKLNNAMGQILLAKRMGKKRIIAETGAGQHGVATATVCAMFDLPCVVYMGKEDIRRQEINVFRMKLLGAEVVSVETGAGTLSDAVDAAFADLSSNLDDTFYLLGSAVGPYPYPDMVKYFQSVIGREARKQIIEKENRLPDYIVACVGGGSNAIGLFSSFVNDEEVKIVAAEAAGRGVDKIGDHCATLTKGEEGFIHGYKSLVLKDEKGDIAPTHSISSGLDYPGVSPEISYFKKNNRVSSVAVADKEALEAFSILSRCEGIIPALESSHAIYAGVSLAKNLKEDMIIIVNLSGRGDKDIDTVLSFL